MRGYERARRAKRVSTDYERGRTVAYLEIGKGVCHNLRRGADTPWAPALMIDIRAACDMIQYIGSRYT